MTNLDATMMNSLATLQAARQAQIASLAQQRFGGELPLSLPAFPLDTVTLGSTPENPGLIPDPRRIAQAYPNNQDAYFDEVLKQLAILKAAQAATEAKSGTNDGTKSSQKGDLNVVAGNRSDGVKAKKVTIHQDGKWNTRQRSENIGEYKDHESKFSNAKVGEYYDVWVEWEDGTTTHREVRMESPGQTVRIDSQY